MEVCGAHARRCWVCRLIHKNKIIGIFKDTPPFRYIGLVRDIGYLQVGNVSHNGGGVEVDIIVPADFVDHSRCIEDVPLQ